VATTCLSAGRTRVDPGLSSCEEIQPGILTCQMKNIFLRIHNNSSFQRDLLPLGFGDLHFAIDNLMRYTWFLWAFFSRFLLLFFFLFDRVLNFWPLRIEGERRPMMSSKGFEKKKKNSFELLIKKSFTILWIFQNGQYAFREPCPISQYKVEHKMRNRLFLLKC
jgi:hypothetical protein